MDNSYHCPLRRKSESFQMVNSINMNNEIQRHSYPVLSLKIKSNNACKKWATQCNALTESYPLIQQRITKNKAQHYLYNKLFN